MEVALGDCGFIGEGEDQLSVVGVGDNVESMLPDDGCEQGHIHVEESGSQRGALRHSAADFCGFRVERW